MANTVEILLRLGGAAQVQAQLKGVQGAFASINSAYKATAGFLAASGVTSAIRVMWKAAEESRVATFQLAKALELAGEASSGAMKAFEAQAGALQSLTAVSDETVMSVQKMLLSMGATANQVEQLTPLVLDVAAAMGIDATTAARQLGAALDGQDVRLGRLNIKAASFEELLGVLNQRFKGQAQALAEARGPMASMNVALDEMVESLGHLVTWTAAPIVTELNKVAQAMAGVTSFRFDAATSQALAMLFGMSPTATGARSIGALFPGQGMAQGASSRFSFANRSGGGGGGFDEESASIEGERSRQATATQALVNIEADLNNQYAFRRALIEQDPNMTEADRRAGLVAVLRDEVQVQQQLEDLRLDEFQRQLQADPGRTLETTIEAERQLGDAQLRRLQITQQIQSLSEADTFGGKLRQNLRGLVDEFGNLKTSLANVTFQTVTNAVEGLSGALTAVIMGTKTAGQAFAQFGTQLLTSFIQSILTAVIYAEIALPILSALGVASGGASFGAGVPIVAAGLAAGTAAGAAAARRGGRKAGGYTGDGPVDQVAGYHHRGEFIFPANRVRELGVANLESMAFGGGSSAGGGDRPLQVVVMDDRRGLDRIMRDPRFRSFVVDLAREA